MASGRRLGVAALLAAFGRIGRFPKTPKAIISARWENSPMRELPLRGDRADVSELLGRKSVASYASTSAPFAEAGRRADGQKRVDARTRSLPRPRQRNRPVERVGQTSLLVAI